MSSQPVSSTFRTDIDGELSEFARRQNEILSDVGGDLTKFLDAAAGFVKGGKRLRPQFCHAGWLAAGGNPNDASIVTVAAAFEWLQASALIHDDVMDESDTRRGQPSVHRAFESSHVAGGLGGDPAGFGRSVAVLLGDLTLAWSDEMFTNAILNSPTMLPHLADARYFFDRCKSEVVAGQYLDTVGQISNSFSLDDAMRVIRFKSAKYTVERPLHVGAALAGADRGLIEILSAFGLPLGEAFQLRDDILGVFGDPEVTGKPAGDDIREGKRTVLIARTAENTDQAGLELLRSGLGTEDLVDDVKNLILESGALEAVEADITRLETEARDSIHTLETSTRRHLEELLLRTTRRTH